MMVAAVMVAAVAVVVIKEAGNAIHLLEKNLSRVFWCNLSGNQRDTFIRKTSGQNGLVAFVRKSEFDRFIRKESRKVELYEFVFK